MNLIIGTAVATVRIAVENKGDYDANARAPYMLMAKQEIDVSYFKEEK